MRPDYYATPVNDKPVNWRMRPRSLHTGKNMFRANDTASLGLSYFCDVCVHREIIYLGPFVTQNRTK